MEGLSLGVAAHQQELKCSSANSYGNEGEDPNKKERSAVLSNHDRALEEADIEGYQDQQRRGDFIGFERISR